MRNAHPLSSMVIVTALCAIALRATLSSAAPVTEGRLKVLLPDGEPAAGVTVVLRSHLPDGSAFLEKNVTTDADGVFSFEAPAADTAAVQGTAAATPPTDQTVAPQPVTYALIDIPQCAFTVVPLSGRGSSNLPFAVGAGLAGDGGAANVPALRLARAYELHGGLYTYHFPTAAGETLTPIVGAKVYVNPNTAVPSLRINDPLRGISTPQLSAKTDDKGLFTLRGFDVSGRESMYGIDVSMYGYVWAVGQADGRMVTGTGTVTAYRRGADFMTRSHPARPDPQETLDVSINVTPAVKVRGQVLNDLTGAPIAGAKVLVTPGFPTMPDAVVTDAAGQFAIDNCVGRSFLVSQPGFASMSVGLAYHEKPRDLEEPVLRLRPLVTVKGRILDLDTGQPPPVPLQVSASRWQQHPTGDMESSSSPPVTMEPDGSFALQVGVGPISISFVYEVWPASHMATPCYLKTLQQDVPATGLQDLVLKVRRQPTFLLRFSVTDSVSAPGAPGQLPQATPPGHPRELGPRYTFTVRTAEGKETRYGLDPATEWCYPALKWGDKLQIKVPTPYNGADLLPWTEITADRDQWPRVIKLTAPPAPPVVNPEFAQ